MGCSKTQLRGKCLYFKNEERSQINNLNSHLEEPEKEEQTKPEVIRRKDY